MTQEVMSDFVADELERRSNDGRPVLGDLSCEPLVEVEVLAATGECGEVEGEEEGAQVENEVEDLEILRDVQDSRDVDLGLGVVVPEGGQEVLRIGLEDAEEDELVRRLTAEEGREESSGELGVGLIPRLLKIEKKAGSASA